ncbi:cytochrome d ubiquinol oxidase, subunit II [Haladaptatus paucihalophilus DX253]|uniref:Cytochrome bd-I ubiquinol oxidase subunit 2 apoprotein n=1 Tax=Haladaptatus paucihalophilus DX253 TaxID=797209 RepID=E7QVB8_HALPU|nr:cytochrome d ubiquinol oxidase subunit II [Haladaptatus paucihalophilus]EFW91636.1 cytochrome d ubiquinol oxidase, subunit II [Haladaptatus paucihalophilus DX253]SHL22293.1 cytochrome bd-I ubiquinol oxidase subunit 2 apoprotein [Haladaptatus paucihalophilus DX253]
MIDLAVLWFALVFVLLGTFLFLDGFDFGVGLLFATRDDEEERETLLAAIGPIWDGNEVWLVVFGGALFAVFPAAYAGLFSRHYLLMFAILGALILRGIAPELYEQRSDDRWKRWWGRSFIVGSALSPFLLGMFAANWVLGASTIVSVPSLAFGLTVVALTLVEGAAFLGLKTRGTLRDEMSDYSARAALAYLVLVVVVIGYLAATRSDLHGALLSPLSLAAVVVSVALVAGVVLASRADRHRAAFAAAAFLPYALVAFVGNLLYPAIDPAVGLTVQEGVVSDLPLTMLTVAAAFILPIVVVYFGVVYSVFSGPADPSETY